MNHFDQAAPDWVWTNPVITGLLEYVLDKRDTQILTGEEKPISISLDPSKASRALRPVLAPFNSPDYDDRELWDELKWLATNFRCFDVSQPPRRAAGEAPWKTARLHFRDAAEPRLRQWLQRPRPQAIDPRWQAALEPLAPRFENPIAFPPGGLELDAGFRDHRQLLACWAAVGDELRKGKPLSWRQLSARCFLGDSKFLDPASRQALVRSLFPSQCGRIQERPVLLHLYLPQEPQQLLLIENQDSFLWLAERQPEASALVYIEGYLGGAERIRTPGIARFSTVNAVERTARAAFQQWWQGMGEGDYPVYFWGDLDFEGMNIAAALKRSFPGLDCWQPGYAPLLHQLQLGLGHAPEQCGKIRQRLVTEETGCPYADRELIPVLLQQGRFLDQEAAVFAPSQIAGL